VWYKQDASNNNILQDTINFKFDDINSTYLMRIKYHNGAVYVNNPINSYPLFWVLDNQSGYLQFYSTTAHLLANATIPTNPPKISFYKYVGKKGLLNLDISGQQQVTDLSNIQINLNNLNRMILPDGYVDISGGSPWDLCGNEVVRTYYQYSRSNTFIGYNNLPVLNGNSVDHAQDPSHNGIIYELDVSGNTYISDNLIQGYNNNMQVGGLYNHIEGLSNIIAVNSIGAHIEGTGNQILRDSFPSHVEGAFNIVGTDGAYSHAEGYHTIIDTSGGHATGHWNDMSKNVIFVVGCGKSNTNRMDAIYVDTSCVTHINNQLDVSGNLIVLGDTQLQDVSMNNLEVSGNLIVLGDTQLQDVSTNDLDVSGNLIVLGHTQLQDISTNKLEVSGKLID